MKILSFGHIPTWAGGRQSSGLANVIFHLAKNMSSCEDVDGYLCATDVFSSIIHNDNLKILGWSKSSLIKYSLRHPVKSISWLNTILYSRIKFGKEISILGYFFKGMHLSSCIDVVKPDVIHLHGMSSCIFNKIVPHDIKIIVTLHGMVGADVNIPNYYKLSLMEKEVCKSDRYTFVAFIAEKLKRDYIGFYGGIVSFPIVIPNAYNDKKFFYVTPKSKNKLTLATIASISDRKGQIRVLKAIAKSNIYCQYLCIGNGSSDMITINDSIAEQNNIDYKYLGPKSPDEIREILAQVDYMILPSSSEGFGLVFLEAIACGIPVILPKHLPIVEQDDIIKPGINAILMDDSDEESIKETLLRLNKFNFNHKSVAESISGYSWANISQKYIDTVKQFI